MGDLDWTKIWAMGFAPPGSLVPKKSSRPEFKTDFYEAYFKAKEKKLLDKQNGEKKEVITAALAALTHKRCVAVFSKIVPDTLSIGHAFERWKDVNAYERSVEIDGGETYRRMNMSLMDLKLASTATSVGKSTRKLQVALMGDFEAEAQAVVEAGAEGEGGFGGKDRKSLKKATRTAERKRMTDGVLREINKNIPTDNDVVAHAIGSRTLSLHGLKPCKVDRILSGPAMRSVRNVLPEVKKRKELRDGLEKHFADIVRAREKENEAAILAFEEEQRLAFEDSPLRRRVTDRFGDTIEGGFELTGMASLKALESVRMLSGMGPSGMGRRDTRGRDTRRLPR